MTNSFEQYLKLNINKFLTLIFSIIFVITFLLSRGCNTITITATVILLVLNICNFFVNKKWSMGYQTLIFEIIGVFGVYYISWYYVLVFALASETIHFFRTKLLLILTIIINSSFYTYTFYRLSTLDIDRGFSQWQIITFLIISIALSIFFVIAENEYEGDHESKQVSDGFEQKYLELKEEHQHTLVLKEIMDISTQTGSINEIMVMISELLLKKFDNIDYITIFLFDEKRKEFRIVTSNVSVHYQHSLCKLDQFEEFDDVISSKYGKVLNSEMGLLYPTASERNIMSALCTPLHNQKGLMGLILMESHKSNAFSEVDINRFNLIRYNISLVIENKQWVERIEKMALVDGLTGVFNRNYLFDFLESQMKWHKENNKKLCLVLFDLDHFKRFNDTYGHLFGDLVLKEVSGIVKDSIRDADIIARYGGEEFIIVLTDTPMGEAEGRINEIRLKIQYHSVKNEEGVSANVTVSFGIAEFDENSYNISIKDLIEHADKALYKSKEEGRNRVSIYKGE